MALTIFISIILLALCVTGLAISVLLKKNGAFPQTEIGANPRMRTLGLRCAREEELEQCAAATGPTDAVRQTRPVCSCRDARTLVLGDKAGGDVVVIE